MMPTTVAQNKEVKIVIACFILETHHALPCALFCIQINLQGLG
jgi:hypothetical protein